MTGRVVTLGEGLAVLTTGEHGSLAHLDRLRVSTGGAEANVAIGLARLQIPVTWLGRVGKDAFGRRVARELRAEGVDTRAVEHDGAPTGLLVKERPGGGRTRVLSYRAGSAGSRLAPADVAALGIPGAALLHVTGITPGLSASAADAVDAAVRIAGEHGVDVSFDVNHRPSVWAGRDPAATYRRIVRSARIVFAGLDEARLLVPDAGADVLEVAATIAALGPEEVVIKLGPAGAVARVSGTSAAVAAVPVEVVDTVGAGDAFVAGYLAERALGADIAVRLRTAALAGALACTATGDWEAAPTREDLRAMQDEQADPVQR